MEQETRLFYRDRITRIAILRLLFLIERRNLPARRRRKKGGRLSGRFHCNFLRPSRARQKPDKYNFAGLHLLRDI
jgi:hypothetical protein